MNILASEFKKIFNSTKEKWYGLAPREQKFVLFGGLLMLVMLYWLGLYLPLSNAVSVGKQQLVEKRQLLHWMRWQQQFTALPIRPQLSTTQLMVQIKNTLQHSTLNAFPYQLQLTNTVQSEVTLKFDQVPFNAVMVWLWNLDSNYQFTIKHLTVENTKTPGVIQFSLLIGPL